MDCANLRILKNAFIVRFRSFDSEARAQPLGRFQGASGDCSYLDKLHAPESLPDARAP